MAKLADFLIKHLEVILAGMSLPVIALVHLFLSVHFDNAWKVTAAAAITIGVLHGTIAWLVRSRQRSVRLALLQRTWSILQENLTVPGQQIDDQVISSPYSDRAIRLALAQLPAILREPVIIRTVPSPAPRDPGLPPGLHA